MKELLEANDLAGNPALCLLVWPKLVVFGENLWWKPAELHIPLNFFCLASDLNMAHRPRLLAGHGQLSDFYGDTAAAVMELTPL